MNSAKYDEKQVLDALKHYLPSQQALKDFIHHNPLHAFQHLKFYEAIFKASTIFGFQVHLQLHEFREMYQTGRIRKEIVQMLLKKKYGTNQVSLWMEKLLHQSYQTEIFPRIGRLRSNWKKAYQTDLDTMVQPMLFRIVCAYLDQGIALYSFPSAERNFLDALKSIEEKSGFSFFKTREAKLKFLSGDFSISSLLSRIVGDEAYFEQYLFDQQLSHHGWSGFIAAAEKHPTTLLSGRPISLESFVALELLMEWDALQADFGNDWEPLVTRITEPPVDLFAAVAPTEFATVISIWQEAFEWSYYDSVLKGIQVSKPRPLPEKRSFQAVFCIDEREDSLRRHIEAVDRQAETFGAPGFFGVEFYFQQDGSLHYDKLCPAPVTPKYLIKETGASTHHKNEPLYSKLTHGLVSGFFLSIGFGFWAMVKKVQMLFRPKMSPAISNAYGHMDQHSKLSVACAQPPVFENGLQVGYQLDEMLNRAESFLRGIGLVEQFAPIVYLVSHGSSSANNPHHGAHDCGACSGRPGATNARVQAFILNHEKVRALLKAKGITIPEETQFIGAMHDTAADVIAYYDENILHSANKVLHQQHKENFETALNINAKERSRRFASINTRQEMAQIRKAIHERSVSLFEPRPELGHGTNTLAIIGRRQTSKAVFLDRRAFLNSYDYKSDPDGTILAAVMRPIGLVCGGINLEYYFSRVDNIKMGAGTKLPHNVMGLFAVANSSDGDLRPGLPWQMIEVHDPVRIMVIVEQQPAIVHQAIQSSPDVYEWYKNEWVHLVALDPIHNQYYYFRNEAFEKYDPITGVEELKVIHNMEKFIEAAGEMTTNHITHATEENLPVYLLD